MIDRSCEAAPVAVGALAGASSRFVPLYLVNARAFSCGIAELVLWNCGTVIVAVADLALAPSGVLAGSVLLVIAFVLFTRELSDVNARSSASTREWRAMYAVLLIFLAVSTITGTVLGIISGVGVHF